MREYVVEGSNWKIDINLDNVEQITEVDDDYIEAATRAVEKIYESQSTSSHTSNGHPAQVGEYIQVTLKMINNMIEDKAGDTSDERIFAIDNGFMRLVPTPMVLSNAGQYNAAEFILSIMDEKIKKDSK